VEAPGYDPPRHVELAVPAQTAQISLPFTPVKAVAHHWQADGSVSLKPLVPAASFQSLTTDLLTIIELTAPGSEPHRSQPKRYAPRSS
jgi:hypothetical protein